MVSGGHVGLRASDFVQLRQQVWCQAGSIDRRAANIDFRAGNNVCRSALVAQFVLVAIFLYVINQAFVQAFSCPSQSSTTALPKRNTSVC